MKPRNSAKYRTILLLSFLIIHCTLYIAQATIRYVSTTGSSTPPYTTWETAADSIQECINICEFGDTIYVANGVYKEQVIMIPGLSLIGAGMDSCTIDNRTLATQWDDIAIQVADSCLLKGFKIIVSNNFEEGIGMGIAGSGSSGCLVTLNKVTYASNGIFLDATFFGMSDITVYNNICEEVGIGINLFNSNAIVRNNFILIRNISGGKGILLSAFDNTYKPTIDSNIIYSFRDGINKSFGTNPTITNNRIYLNGPGAEGITLSLSDSAMVCNNTIIVEEGFEGIYNSGTQYLQLNNNYIIGNFIENGNAWAIGIGYPTVFPDNAVKNNVVVNVKRGVRSGGNFNFQYNNVWNNTINYQGFTPDSTNISLDPMVMNDDTTKGKLDFRLQMFSPLIDAGDPNILDKDSSRSDIGLYGGPYGESYVYIDLPPRPPVNLSAEIDTNYITVKWNKNTEADFSHYNLYRDTTANFTLDTTNYILSLTDTFYVHIIPPGKVKYYYKLTAADNQGNVSEPSEELPVNITGTEEYPSVISSYMLYQNYPNPFNPSTKISYRLIERGYVKLYVYDVKGELVSVLVNQNQESGYYEVEFNVQGSEFDFESQIASGIYIYQILISNENRIPVFSDIKKMILLK